VSLQADEELPDCCFVEDAAVAIGEFGSADSYEDNDGDEDADAAAAAVVLLRAGAASRVAERGAVAATLREHLPDVDVYSEEHSGVGVGGSKYTLDGGDVMFTGREFFVGRSARVRSATVAMRRRFVLRLYVVQRHFVLCLSADTVSL
jgi:N-dimethylarginine dimethylaminohydrolase